MIYNKGIANEYPVYPGEYVLLPEVRNRLARFKTGINDNAILLPVNMNELAGCYRIDVGIPGAARENILLDIIGNILSIIVFRQTSGDVVPVTGTPYLNEFSEDFIERHILLPENANVEFMSAAYANGILRLDIPKEEFFPTIRSNQVVVY